MSKNQSFDLKFLTKILVFKLKSKFKFFWLQDRNFEKWQSFWANP